MIGPGGFNDSERVLRTTPAWENDAELGFAEDERLPWLESDDDDHASAAIAPGRVAMFVGLGALSLLILIGGAWWLTNRDTGGGSVAQGGIIEAPEAPYKVRPQDAGGKEFEGTGDTSFAVGEGQSREGRLADTPTVARGPLTTAATPAATQAAATPSIAAVEPDEEEIAQANDGVGVQVGAYSSKAQAETGWQTLQRQTEALSGVRHRVVRGRADIGIVYRLQAVAGSAAEADSLCRALRSDGLDCQVKR